MSQSPTQKPTASTTNPDTGLTVKEAQARQTKYGANKLVEEQKIQFLTILREEITEPMILLLIAIGVLYGVINQGNVTDSLTILVIVVVLVLVEVRNEYRAKKSISALKKLASPTTKVLRDGKTVEVPTEEVVVGDILLLGQGDLVPADAQLIEAVGLEMDESTLTGESFPAAKDSTIIILDHTPLIGKQNRVYAGTVVTKGHAKAETTAIGTATELGRVADITKTAKEPKTPMQLSMKQLAKTLVWIALFFSILIPVLSYLRGLPAAEAVLYGLSLSFATIPEELPIIITMVLGVGAYSLSRKKAIVKRLRAAETLGSTTVIATDKTGTITENRMRVEALFYTTRITQRGDFGQNQKEALKTALLATDAIKDVTSSTSLSNPMSQALLEANIEFGADLKALQETWVLKEEREFDNQRKLASYVYQLDNGFIMLSSGAPEYVLAKSTMLLFEGQETRITDDMRRQLAEAFSDMAKSGQRLLAFSYRRISLAQRQEKQDLEQNLVFVGVIGFLDPPRKEVKEAIRQCQQAGIKVVMVTGDHPDTASAIAAQVGIENGKVLKGTEIAEMTDEELQNALRSTFVFARTSPEDKLRLVRLLHQNGEIVAVTGDGVNDAPALKEAHIGIAMGIRGTDVAKEAADMVLADDNFATITTAVRGGRKIFANLKKGVRYYLACKIALVASFLLPVALGVPLPFAPIQIIVLELFMDLAASATFVAEPQETGVMKKPPLSPTEKFMNRPMLTAMALGALSLFAAVSTSYLYSWYTTGDLAFAQTMAFATWMVGHVFLALNFRSEKEPLTKLGLFSNKFMLLWALVVAVTLVVGTNLPSVHAALKITSLGLADWAVVIAVAFATTFWIESKKLLTSKNKKC
ncbi:MAG: cation-transporting P-type ATPase [Candidatus Bathyarchaeota archaeon]|nr:cation-transporting P-type ATPase [Candidatus Bathyarchaeota archaeon]